MSDYNLSAIGNDRRHFPPEDDKPSGAVGKKTTTK
jgi:hypothetical protein